MRLELTVPRCTGRLVTLGLALLLLMVGLVRTPTQAAPLAQFTGTVVWDKDPTIISNGQRSGFARVAVDGNNVTHVIYATDAGAIVYTNNIGGAFNLSGIPLASGTYDTNPNVAIAIGRNNSIHVAYVRAKSDDHLYYRMSSDVGQHWSDPIELSSAPKARNPDIAIDPATGDAHIVWIDNSCGTQYNVRYRVRRATGSLDSTQTPKSECSIYQNRPAITFAGGKPHIVYQRDSSAGEIYYTRRESTGWVTPIDISQSGTRSEDPTITSDGGNNIFVAWDENTNGHDIRFTASFDGGQIWSPWIPFSDSPELASQPYASWSPRAKRVHVVWSDRTASEDGLEEIWERQFDPVSKLTTAADRITHLAGHSYWPAVAAGSQRASIVWHDDAQSTYQIWHLGGNVSGGTTPSGCNGALVLDNGAAQTSTPTLTGIITPEANCTPDQMQIALNQPITDATPKLTYSSNLPPITAQAGTCSQTIYVRLFRNGAGGTPFSDSIVVDNAINATVRVSNPHMFGLPPLVGLPGAPDGDAHYTRETKFSLGIGDAGDCTGLSTFDIPSAGSGTIINGNYTGLTDLPNTIPGLKQFIVNVHDQIGNVEPFQRSITYDPIAPMLDNSASPTVTAPLSSARILVPLAFQNIRVTDNLYGPEENLPADAEFWGVLLANSTTVVSPDNPGLNWLPVQVSSPSSTFTITWDLLSGLSSPPPMATGGNMYVYIRFVDGAGNPTQDAIAVREITLEPNYTLSTMHLPMVNK